MMKTLIVIEEGEKSEANEDWLFYRDFNRDESLMPKGWFGW